MLPINTTQTQLPMANPMQLQQLQQLQQQQQILLHQIVQQQSQSQSQSMVRSMINNNNGDTL